jgi:endonuclease V-like protein UPF0215 family
LIPLSIVGVEDGGFVAFKPCQSTLLCAVLMVGDRIEVVRLGKITVDGLDSTNILLEMLVKINCDGIILGGISFAGFNIVDPQRVNNELGVPIIVYSGKRPNSISMLVALKAHFIDWEERCSPITRLGNVYNLVTKAGFPPIFFEVVGESKEWAINILKESALLTRAPEPVRVAGIVVRGLTRSA